MDPININPQNIVNFRRKLLNFDRPYFARYNPITEPRYYAQYYDWLKFNFPKKYPQRESQVFVEPPSRTIRHFYAAPSYGWTWLILAVVLLMF